MSVVLGQIAVLIGLTHAFRALAIRMGPRRGGLFMGLPTTTAVMLVCCAVERGVGEATGTSEACLLGLVAAASAPLIYARVVSAGIGFPWAPIAAMTGYLGVIAALRWLPAGGAPACVLMSAVGVLAACRLASGMRIAEESPRGTRPAHPRGLSERSMAVSRSAVPAAYYLVVRGLRTAAGPAWAGQFMTFPGASLSVLVNTHLESGPGAAVNMAAAMPLGGLGMFAFLTTFRFACPELGLFWGTALAYAAAVAMLMAIGAALRGPDVATLASIPLRRRDHRGVEGDRCAVLRVDPATRRSRPTVKLRTARRARRHRRRRRRFSPKVEALSV